MRSNEPGSQKHAKLLTYSSFFFKELQSTFDSPGFSAEEIFIPR